MAALYLRLTLAILISIRCRRRRRQKILIKKRLSNRKMWVRPTINVLQVKTVLLLFYLV